MKKDKFKLEIIGLEETIQMLDSLPKLLNNKIQLDISRRAGNIAKKVIQSHTPSKRAKKAVKVTRSKQFKYGVSVGYTTKGGHLARWIEKGTKDRKTKKGVSRGRMPAKPFIVSAHKDAADKVMRFMEGQYLKLLDNAIRKQVRAINKKIERQRRKAMSEVV